MKPPVFALQVTNRDDADLHKTVEALDKLGLEWINFGVIPFTDEITNLDAFPKDRTVVPLAGTKVISMYLRKKLPPNWRIVYDMSKFDQCYTRLSPMHLLMLNRNTFVRAFVNIKDLPAAVDTFVKPTNDLKVFAGTVIPAGTTLAQHLLTINHQPIADYDQMLVGPAIQTSAEYRLFMSGYQLLDASEYKRDGRVAHKVVDKETMFKLRFYINQMRDYLAAHNFRPVMPHIYCMDLVESDGRHELPYEIIEFNCFHASGMYTVNRAHVLAEVARIFS